MRLWRNGDPNFIVRRPAGSVTKEQKLKERREKYRLNPHRDIENAARYRAENKEKCRATRQAYYDREGIRDRYRNNAKEWYRRNKDLHVKNVQEWAKENRALVRSRNAKRRAAQRNATPPWLTEVQLAAIKEVYAEARRLEIEHGTPYHVDHIVPLSGKTVCGLHVPWNLRAIPGEENNRRPRVWDHNIHI